ncbi:bis(5'-nucleosyl)-tetraphosphatase (symmetrical) YqeK [Candidatus Izemoplasma sp. B36]|uniref:bis(5'-nucleosyl)-tetraphosphatase (symmetrical) YqeK n=1 Tax=Candidatus Izemoplasma sp. B36 TaxID=3242468 RepID=UPI0035567CA7
MINEDLVKEIETYLLVKFKNHKKRLKHIYNVKKVAIALGNIYKADIPSVVVASYLHDATKYDEIDSISNLSSNISKGCIHAYTASELARNRFNIQDNDILNAIKYHCSGRINMSLLEKIIFVSDFIEEGREFTSKELRDVAKTNIDKAIYLIMIQTKNYLLKNNQELSLLTEEAIPYYKKKSEEFND